MAKKISKETKFWILTIIFALGLYFFRNIVSIINKILPFMNELYFFILCVGTAMYLARKI